MVVFKTNPDNDEYLNIDIKSSIIGLLDTDMDNEFKQYVHDIYTKLFVFETIEKTGYVSEISIKKDSMLGKYLLTAKKDKVNNLDNIINYENVVSAFNIAVYEDSPMQIKLLPMFKEKVSGRYDELYQEYDINVLDYILENSDFMSYVNKNSEDYKPKEYVVYENDQYIIKPLDILKNSEKIKR